MFLKEFFEKVNFETKSQHGVNMYVRQQKHEKLPNMQRYRKTQFDIFSITSKGHQRTVQLPGRFYKPRVLQGFLILFTEEKLKTRMDFACVSREPRTSPARFLLRVAGIFHETLAGHHA